MPSGSTSTCAFRKWSPASSVMPTAIGAPSRAASAATSSRSTLVGEVVDVDHVLGPHDQVDGALQRPGGGQMALERPPAGRCRRRGCPGARRPAPAPPGSCRPGGPAGPAPRPAGAGRWRRPAPRPAATAARSAADSATPRPTVTSVRSSAPPSRASGARGPAAWPMASDASGTPSNGNANRTASTRVMAAGRPSQRQRPPGATAAAVPRKSRVERRRERRSRARSGTTSTPCPAPASRRRRGTHERSVTATDGGPAAGRARRSRRWRGATSPTGAAPGQRELRHRGWRRPQRGSGGPTSWRRHVRRWPSWGGGAWPIAPTVPEPTTWAGADPSCSRLPRSCSDARRRTGRAHRLLRG